jgi:predicted nucleotidyltransferase
MDVEAELVPKLAALPHVVAVVLGGSRAAGTHRPDSDWDFGLYYRGSFDADLLAGLGHPGHTAQPGEWGRIVNGGAWLSVGGEPVDVLLRDLDVIDRWHADAREGRFEVDHVEGHLAGLPTYVPVGEMALNRVLHGELPEVTFPPKLREVAGYRWRWGSAFSLFFAAGYAGQGDITACAGMLAKAAMLAAHGVLAARGEWALNEKRFVQRAGLTAAHDVFGKVAADPEGAVEDMRALLKPPDLTEMGAHTG